MLQCGWQAASLTCVFSAKPFEKFGDTWVAPYQNLYLEVFPQTAQWGGLRAEKMFEDYVVDTKRSSK